MNERRISIAAVIGTRPEAIKLAPVILAARERPAEFSVSVIRTGQHRELVDRLMDEFDIRADVDLKVMRPSQDLAHVMAESVRGLSEVFAQRNPDWVLVQGDTTTTFAGALAAFYNGVRVAHVEAGLRTGHRHSPFPEEVNRSLTACVADLHFAPTEQARSNLLREGVPDCSIVVTGNTVIDALFQTLERLRQGRAAADRKPARRYVLVTTHRRENHGAALRDICSGLMALLGAHADLSVWVPMHPSPTVREVLMAELGGHARVRLTEPLGYTEFIEAMDGAELVLTDSGGVQEECAALGKPVLVLREDTERPEAVDAGTAVLVGTAPNRILSVASALLGDPESYRKMSHPTTVFGDGRASLRILDALAGAGPGPCVGA
ncbi:MAG: UDP-N-acetylglucosamine 2-epimerase (non-hydrolyzing) [Caldimonas sp.]